MYKIGLTGGIGSGKSTVSNYLKEIGFRIIDADKISRDVLIKYPEILKNIKSEFGEEVFEEDGTINRKELGLKIFNNNEKKIALEKIIMPYIIKDIFDKFEEYYKLGEELAILDAPTLIENKLHNIMDYNILITVNKDVRIQRIKDRDNLDEEQIIKRIESQLSDEEKSKYVDVVIDNNGIVEDTIANILEVIEGIQENM